MQSGVSGGRTASVAVCDISWPMTRLHVWLVIDDPGHDRWHGMSSRSHCQNEFVKENQSRITPPPLDEPTIAGGFETDRRRFYWLK